MDTRGKPNKKNIELTDDIRNGADLLNRNCYDYLKNIAEKIGSDHSDDYELKILDVDLQKLFKKIKDVTIRFDNKFSYQSLYQEFQVLFSKKIKNILAKAKAPILIKKILNAIYQNENHALERSAMFAQSALGDSFDLLDRGTEKKILIVSNKSHSTTAFLLNPGERESLYSKTVDMLGSNYQPQTTTNIPSVRAYQFHQDKSIFWSELRFGTQGEYIDGNVRVNPLFDAWLKIQAKNSENSASTITHIYFNNLGFDREDWLEGQREKKLTLVLHGLEDEHSNVAVITLPANEGLMDHQFLKDDAHTSILWHSTFGVYTFLSWDSAYNKIFNIATTFGSQIQTMNTIKDFYISDSVKKILYGIDPHHSDQYDRNNENNVIDLLLSATLKKLGFSANTTILSPAQFQAVYFHFIKFELTNYIINTLQPLSINFSCKDAIDRGGISSLYFNLIKSIELGHPITKDEFFIGLYGAPTAVKGRGMNKHIDILWNAINAYLQAQPNNDQVPTWLRDMAKDINPIFKATQKAPEVKIYDKLNIIEEYDPHNNAADAIKIEKRRQQPLPLQKLPQKVSVPVIRPKLEIPFHADNRNMIFTSPEHTKNPTAIEESKINNIRDFLQKWIEIFDAFLKKNIIKKETFNLLIEQTRDFFVSVRDHVNTSTASSEKIFVMLKSKLSAIDTTNNADPMAAIQADMQNLGIKLGYKVEPTTSSSDSHKL